MDSSEKSDPNVMQAVRPNEVRMNSCRIYEGDLNEFKNFPIEIVVSNAVRMKRRMPNQVQ